MMDMSRLGVARHGRWIYIAVGLSGELHWETIGRIGGTWLNFLGIPWNCGIRQCSGSDNRNLLLYW